MVVGATSDIALAIMERLFHTETRQIEFVLVGRDQYRLNLVKAHLKILGAVCTTKIVTAPEKIESTWFEIETEGPTDWLLIAQGILPEHEVDSRLVETQNILAVNTIAPITWCQCAAASMATRIGRIAVIGSVAGDRGRLKNHIYAASKRALETYCEGLALRIGPQVKVCLIKPGITATAMTANLKHGLLTSTPEKVAKAALNGIKKGRLKTYAPASWAFIMAIIQNLPAWVLRKTGI